MREREGNMEEGREERKKIKTNNKNPYILNRKETKEKTNRRKRRRKEKEE